MNFYDITNWVFGIVGFVALVIQHYEIKALRRKLKQSQKDALHAHNTVAFWQDMSDAWQKKYEIANALCFEIDPLNLLKDKS